MRTLLIDPVAETVKTIAVEGHDFQAHNDLIEARCGTIVKFRYGDGLYYLWLDDEGRLTGKKPFYHPKFYPDILCGKALVFKMDEEEGDSASCDIPADVIAGWLEYEPKEDPEVMI